MSRRDRTPDPFHFEEDWETSGQEEMNALAERCKSKITIMDVRDRINNIKELVHLCSVSLHQNDLLIDIKTLVGNVLHFIVEEQLRCAEKDLEKL